MLHLADALRTKIGGAVVEQIGVFQQIGEEVADGGRDDEGATKGSVQNITTLISWVGDLPGVPNPGG
jgi:hypothetical protein